MRIVAATLTDLPAATDCMVAAFPEDPLIGAFFDDSPLGRARASALFFSILFEARLRNAKPAFVAWQGEDIAGIAMGDDTGSQEWPDDVQQKWKALEEGHAALAAQFADYDRIVDSAQLEAPHYHLGVLAVAPRFQGMGIGKALLETFLRLSDEDEKSHGTVLETASFANVRLYERFGFSPRSSGPVDSATLWCMYRPNARGARSA